MTTLRLEAFNPYHINMVFEMNKRAFLKSIPDVIVRGGDNDGDDVSYKCPHCYDTSSFCEDAEIWHIATEILPNEYTDEMLMYGLKKMHKGVYRCRQCNNLMLDVC